MQNFMETILSAVKAWTKGKIKDSTADWNQNDPNADNYIKNRTHWEEKGIVHKLDSKFLDLPTNLATTDYAMAKNNPVGTGSFSMGRRSDTTIGANSHAEGYVTTASGDCSHAEGYDTNASGAYSHAEGKTTVASGEYSHTEGYYSISSGYCSHAEGCSFFVYLTTSGDSNATTYHYHNETYSTDELAGRIVRFNNSESKIISNTGDTFTVESTLSENSLYYDKVRVISAASGDYSHTEGSGTSASGDCSHAEGLNTTASRPSAHAEGSYTIAFGHSSHAEGFSTFTSGNYSHAEGINTYATGDYSHAEGYASKASGSSSHAEGSATKANGSSSHAEGSTTEAKGSNSHAEGYGTIASGKDSHTQGRYNVEDTYDKYAHIVGNGTSDTKRANAHTLDWSGNAWFQGDVYVGGAGQDDEGADRLVKTADLKNEINVPRDEILLIDRSTRLTYRIYMKDGNLVSESAIDDTLKDFEYVAEDDGTYTLTGWKQTLNGQPSTECVIPDIHLINL